MYSSNEEMISKLEAGGLSEFDVTVPSNYSVKEMIALNLIEPFDKGSIPNIKNIDPSALKRNYDPTNEYTVPYMMSPCVLVVNEKKVTKPITSFNDLLDPSLKNQIVVVNDERPIIGIALSSLGYSCNDTNQAHLTQALAWLQKLKPNIKLFDSDSPKTSLISGDCNVGYIYNGEASLAIKANPDLKIVWTKEGLSGLIIDNLAVIKGTQHKKEAEMFINYLLDPSVSAQITAAYPYTNPNLAAHALLGSSYLNNPAINISSEKIKSANLIDDVGNSLPNFDNIWSTFMS
jgi:spermidine/putrescine-binding protein